jgi:[acyl-carrier-protein] S-malonyltransferase
MKGIAFLFPGQGSQYVGMGKELYDNFAIARQTFEEANDALGFDLQKLCFEGDLQELTRTENTQPAILTTSVAAFRVLQEKIRVTPEYTAGHSLGEYSALVCAGALAFADAVKIVQKRGQFMQEAVPVGVGSMMAVIKLDRREVDAVCQEVSTPDEMVVPANYNSQQQIVISGHVNAVNRAGEILTARGATVKPLNVSAPFHSPLIQSAADRMKEELQTYTLGQMRWPVLSNVSARPYRVTDQLLDNLVAQIVQPVRWHESMDYIQRQGVTKAIEIGPKTVLKNLMRGSFPGVEVVTLDTLADLENVLTWLPKPDLRNVLTRCNAVIVTTRNQNWDNDEYHNGVIAPYKKLQQMQAELEKTGNEPTREQGMEALAMVKTVFQTKKLPLEEQITRLEEILDMTGTWEVFTDFEMPA